MANQTQIVNLALSWLGQGQINNINDNQNEAKIMKANYDLSLDKLLGEHAWTFALRQEILPPLGPAPTFGGGQQFQIPSDVIFVHRVFRPNNSTLQSISNLNQLQNARWERIGDKINASQETLWCLFVVRVTNTDMFPPAFVHALAARLAADTCLTFTENNRMAIRMEEMYEAKLTEAAVEDGRQGRTETWNASKLTGVRTR